MAVVALVAAPATIAEAVREALHDAGHRLVVVDRVAEAFEGERPDLLLLDLAAGDDGLAELRRLKSSSTTAGMRVGVLAASGSAEERLECAIEGALLYLTRPLDAHHLARAVDRIVTGEPEDVQRKQVQDAALRALVRLQRQERNEGKPAPFPATTPPSLHAHARDAVSLRRRLDALNQRQREVLDAVATSDTREQARLRLGISRSLLGATLRSITHRLGMASVSELIATARGDLAEPRDGGGRGLLFQPVVDMTTGRPLMFEAVPGGCVRRACVEASSWDRSIALAVDVSARRLAAPGAADDILAVLADAGLSPSSLVLEVAETVAVSEDADARHALGALRRAGVRVCADHFGTERSSAASLLRVEIDMVKLDASMLERDHVVAAAVAFAASLAPLVAAEGVDSTKRLTQLQHAGCTAVQGPLVGEPVATPTSDRVGSSSPDRAIPDG